MNTSYCTFIVGWALCGVPVDRVREVISEIPYTPVPLAEDYVAGLINLRGQIVTAIDMSVCLEMNAEVLDRDPERTRNHVVVDVGDERMGLFVDDIGPVIEVDRELIETPPPNLKLAIPKLVSHTARLSEGVLLILDLDQLVEIRHRSNI